MHREDNIMDFENFVASIVKEKFQQFDEEAADAREQQGIAQVGLGTRPMSDRPGLAKEEDEVKTLNYTFKIFLYFSYCFNCQK